MTPNEAQKALENGCDVMKLFPAKFLGPSYIKAIKGPLPEIDIIPTGGINKDNAKEWIKAGAIAIGISSSLIKGTKDQIKRNAKEFVKIISE
jgi:2-dehydro-3-deoxyphosphogluconate aldolase/(4S)-4-hydroxy-2-oxoglutarate aldolase